MKKNKKEVKKKTMEKQLEKEGIYLIEGHPCLVALVYESDNNVVSQRLVDKL